jgi:hypothetical protein
MDNPILPWVFQALSTAIAQHADTLMHTPILLTQFRNLTYFEFTRLKSHSKPCIVAQQRVVNGIAILAHSYLPKELFCKIMSYLPSLKFESNEKLKGLFQQVAAKNAANRLRQLV